MDGDGAAEVFGRHDNKTISVLDGKTGTVLRKIPLPVNQLQRLHHLCQPDRQAWAQDIIVKDRYSQVWAITATRALCLWTHRDHRTLPIGARLGW